MFLVSACIQQCPGTSESGRKKKQYHPLKVAIYSQFRQIDHFLQEANIKQVSKWPTLAANGRIGRAEAREPHDLDVPKHVPLHQCDHSSPQLDTEARPPQLRPQDRPG